MKLISDEYKEQNKLAHQQQKGYGAKGGRRRDEVLRIAGAYGIKNALDYGCGKADLARKVPELDWQLYDPAIDQYNELPQPSEMVICADVLEHIEPEHLSDVLHHLLSLIMEVGLFIISTRQGKRKMPDGSFAHKLVYTSGWWIGRVKAWALEYGISAKIWKDNGKEVFILLKKNDGN